ncbi:sorbitol dehydrogenase-like [Scylla paramamosain]|uniref:sorbitol dehydrogenase-like n=1 Tax=Scylla paramamosain TaxID=85552 RepID=UPI003082E2D3
MVHKDEVVKKKTVSPIMKHEDEDVKVKKVTAVMKHEDEDVKVKKVTAVMVHEEEDVKVKKVTTTLMPEDEDVKMKTVAATMMHEHVKVTNVTVVMIAVAKLSIRTHEYSNKLACDEVLVKISKVCICENDDHYVYEGKLGDIEAKMPCGVCTACMGTVAYCGREVTDFKIGDRVTIEPGSPCGCCHMCTSGCYNLCEESTCYMTESVGGGCLAKYCMTKAHLVHKLPDCVCDEDGAMVQPLSMALHACNRAEVSAGSHVLVSGAGCMGLLCVGVAKAMGATKIMVVDENGELLKKACEMGADHTILLNCNMDAATLAKRVEEEMGCPPNVSFECTSTKKGMNNCIHATEASGTVMQVGVCNEEVTLPLYLATMNEIDIKGICCSANCFPVAIEMIENNMVCVNKLISKCYDFSHYQDAFDFLHNNDDCICCIVSCC